ncbi:MAG TPA: cysteine desulfurase-like protein, partial [Longimicrobiales bacterium]|nr:cysteine desulfurase-like protein [Longimicrobiales bacterium]
ANTHWAYATSIETDALLHEARVAAAEFMNGAPDEIVFGANMTTLTFHLARALGRAWREGDEIVVTQLDHHANVAPWTELARERGLVVRVARMLPETGELDWDDVADKVTPRCRLIAIGAASNALGTITDVRRAADMAHAVGAQVFVDAVHYAPHQLVDVHALGCDFLACSAYKFYGPHVGVLWVRRGLVDGIDVPKLVPAADHGPERFETGTLNHEGIVGTTAAIDFLAGLSGHPGAPRRQQLTASLELLDDQGTARLKQMWDGLAALPGVRPWGPPPERPRTPTVAFTVDGASSGEVAANLAAAGVYVSHGDFYARTVVERLGLMPDGLVRAGCACYTAEDDVARLIDGVAATIGAVART